MNTIHATLLCVVAFTLVGCTDSGDTKKKTTSTYDGKPSASSDDAESGSAELDPKTRTVGGGDDVSNDAESTHATPNVIGDSAVGIEDKPAGKPDSAVVKPDGGGPANSRAGNSTDETSAPASTEPAEKQEPKDDEKGLVGVGTAKPEEIDPNAIGENAPKPTQLPADLLDKTVRPLNKEGTVLIDVPRKKIFLKSTVSLRSGALEMLVCLKQTKEHESVLALEGQAYTIHTALVALGMTEGKAARWLPPKTDNDEPKFEPAEGQKIDIFVHWRDTDGKLHREKAQHWIRHTINRYYDEQFESLPADLKLIPDENLRWDDVNKTLFWYGPMSAEQSKELLTRSKDKKYQAAINKFHKQSQPREMAADFLFVGSGFFVEEGRREYLAEGGYVVCVANFNMAMIDISAESNSQGEALSYEAYTERIPPRGSEVLIEFVPAAKPKAEAKPDSATEKKPAEPAPADGKKLPNPESTPS